MRISITKFHKLRRDEDGSFKDFPYENDGKIHSITPFCMGNDVFVAVTIDITDKQVINTIHSKHY